MNFLSKKVKGMKESQTIRMAQLSRALIENGKDVVDLSLGEPDFKTPEYICQAAHRAIDEGYTHYPPVPGYADLRQAISDKFKRENDLDFSPEQIVVSTGAKQSIANLLLSVLDPGDEIILPVPYWVSYKSQVELTGAKVVAIKTDSENEFKITPQQLELAITPKTKAFLFSSPCNPSGSVYNREELEALSNVFAKYPHVLVISDEIYEKIVFDDSHHSIAVNPAIKERTVVINGLSKGYAMTGWRLGYLAAPTEIARACAKIQGQFTSGANAITQRAAIEALIGDQGATEAMKNAFRDRRNLMYELIADIPHFKLPMPKGAFYLFPDVSWYFGKTYNNHPINDANDLAMLLLEEGMLSTVSGTAFGSPECIRLSYATNELKLRKAADRMRQFFNRIQ